MEVVETAVEEHHPKKVRHRKKLLYSSILRQMEFYFSDSNLSKDRFLSKLLEEDENVELSTFLKFNKIRKLTANLDDIIKALQTSELLEISEDKTKIKRKKPLNVKENIEECTIYVEHIKSDTSHEWVSSVFSEFGKVQYVSLPKYKHNKLNKGFAFIEFEHPQEAQKALEYFDSIGLKMSSHMEPDKLCSISTFHGKEDGKMEEVEHMEEDAESKKRKNRESGEHEKKKKKRMKANDTEQQVVETSEGVTDEGQAMIDEGQHKSEEFEEKTNKKKKKSKNVEGADEDAGKVTEEVSASDGEEKKKKKKNKGDGCEKTVEGDEQSTEQAQTNEESEEKKRKKKVMKRKAYFKELGLQILSKDEWRKMRNKYLNNQRNKMKQLKQHLQKRKYQNEEKVKMDVAEDPSKMKVDEEKNKLEFTAGVIVKLELKEACYDVKKTKLEIKNCSPNIQYIDIPESGSEEVFIRFTDGDSAKQFLSSKLEGKLELLNGDEEQAYWEKIRHDRSTKVNKEKKKLRGREKLLKKAERELGKHIRFDE